MKTITLAAATVALIGGAALAGPVDEAIAQLTADGFSITEVETERGRTEIEARKDGMYREILIAASGEILSDETKAYDDDDRDDDGDDDHDDDRDDHNGRDDD